MSRHPYYILSDIVGHAGRFSGAEALLFERSLFADSYPLFQPMCEIEGGLAKHAYWLNRFYAEYELAVAGLSPPPFPVRLRRTLGAIHDMVIERIRRWGWNFVLTSEGLVAIDEKLKIHDETKYGAFLTPTFPGDWEKTFAHIQARMLSRGKPSCAELRPR